MQADEHRMKSVADIPPGDDADDELSGISPELVLVDPDLARLVRERDTAPPAAPPKRTPTLRLVQVEPAIAPRSSEPTPSLSRASNAARPAVPLAPSVGIRHEARAPAQAPPEPPPPAVESTTHSQPVWMAEPAPGAPTEHAEPEDRPESPPAAAPPAMPHPVARTARPTPPGGSQRAARSRGRGALALVAAVAFASLAVLGITRLDGGLPFGASGSGEATAVPPGTPPTAKKTAGSKPETGTSTKPSAKARTSAAKKLARTPPSQSRTAKATAAKAKPSGTPKLARSKPSTAKSRTAAKPRTTAKAKPPGATPAAAPEPRRFAWAPVAGAIGYHVELFRGANRVLEKETTEPVLELAPSWKYAGGTNRLTPGSYRWYVWPVTKSGRSTQAVVQATLDVP